MDLPAVVDAVVELLDTAGVRHVTADPSKLNLPGVLVQWSGVDVDLLAGQTHELRLLLVAPDRDDPRTLAALSDLLAAVVDVVEPSGPVRSRGVRLSTQPSPMPALEYPIRVTYTPNEE